MRRTVFLLLACVLLLPESALARSDSATELGRHLAGLRSAPLRAAPAALDSASASQDIWRTLAPPQLWNHAATYDSENDRMLAFGGHEAFARYGYSSSDPWALSLGASIAWSRVITTGQIPIDPFGRLDAPNLASFGAVRRSDLDSDLDKPSCRGGEGRPKTLLANGVSSYPNELGTRRGTAWQWVQS